jgi:hypothetical protein
MTAKRDTDGIIRAWLDLMPDLAPDRVLTAVHEVVETTPQVRWPFDAVSRRSTSMTRLAWVAVIATLGAVLAGGALFIAASNTPPPEVPASEAATTGPTPSSRASIALAPAPADARQGAPSRLRTVWVADVPAIADLGFERGPVTLTIDDSGQRITSSPVGTAGTFDSTIDLLNYRYNLQLTRDFGDCPAGGHALYKGVETKGEGSDIPVSLEFISISDVCTARPDVLVRTWTRQDAPPASAAP